MCKHAANVTDKKNTNVSKNVTSRYAYEQEVLSL